MFFRIQIFLDTNFPQTFPEYLLVNKTVFIAYEIISVFLNCSVTQRALENCGWTRICGETAKYAHYNNLYILCIACFEFVHCM